MKLIGEPQLTTRLFFYLSDHCHLILILKGIQSMWPTSLHLGYWQRYQSCSELCYGPWHKDQRALQTPSFPPSLGQAQWVFLAEYMLSSQIQQLHTNHILKLLRGGHLRGAKHSVKSQAKSSHFDFWCGINTSQTQSQDPKRANCHCSSAVHYKNTTGRRKQSRKAVFNDISKQWKITAACRDVVTRW